jgi:S1-C subfamily serine protease
MKTALVARRALLVLALVLGVGAGAVQAQRVEVAKSKSGETLKSVFRTATATANRSTVLIKAEIKGITQQVAFGTVISADGYILTKGSEVMGQSKIYVVLAAPGGGTRNYEARIVGLSEPLDLAMLKIEASGLVPVVFADTTPAIKDEPAPDPNAPARGRGGRGRGLGVGQGAGRGRGPAAPPVMPTVTTQPAPPPGAIDIEVGEWVASANVGATMGRGSSADDRAAAEEPLAVGVISVARRRIPGQNGFLGVSMAETPDASGTKIMQVIPESAAEKAGVKVDDVITAINGTPTPSMADLRGTITRFRPGDVVTLTVQRGDRSLTLRATLGVQALDAESPIQAATGGPISQRASDFSAVYQHDTVVRPAECGGPIVDLEGHVLGINIARAGRTETYALPADLIKPVLEPLMNGKMAPSISNSPASHPR